MKTRRYCLRALVWLVFALPGAPINAHPSITAPPTGSTAAQTNAPADCEALKHDPLPPIADSPESSKRLTDCAYLLTNQGDYKRAEVLFDAALAMATRRSDPASRAMALAGLGLTLGTLGQADRAERMLVESLQISEELHDSDGMAEASSQLGHLRTQLGKYDEARAFHLRSFTLWESIGDHKGMAVALNNVGATYRAVGDNATGLEYFQRSLDELERMGDRRRSATVIDNIGRISRTLGDYGTGLELAQKALAIRETLDDREGMSRSLNSLSECYQAQGNDAEAVAYLRKAMALNAASVHSEPLSAEIYTHFGEIYSRQGLHAQAVQSLSRALAVSAKAGLTLQAADARLALARAYLKLGRTALAARTLQEVLSFRNTAGDRSGRAEALIDMAEVERRRGRAAQGLALATEARDMAEAMEIPDVRWLALTAVGRMQAALKQSAAARGSFEAAIGVVESMRVLNAGGEESESRFFADRLAPYQERIALALRGGNGADAFHFAERSKARVLLDVIRGDRMPVTKAMTDAERRHEVALRTSLTSANSELLFAAQVEPRDEARVAGLARKRDERRRAYEDAQAQLYAAHPELRVKRADVPAIRAPEAQQLLSGPLEAIVEFVVGPTRSDAFVISATGLHVFALTAGTAEIGSLVQQFRVQLGNRDLRAGESARRLHQMILGPLRSAIAGKTSLIIVPDGVLWNLPFQALQGGDGRYLIEDAAVSYAPSVTVLRETMRPHPARPAASALIAFGNPAAVLPETEREVRQIAPMYGPSSRVYVGADATEDRWKAEAPSYRVVHLATHGVLDNASPLYSHLVLAPSGRAGGDDGLLEAWEIMNTPLTADLVVLSACETARGRIAAGEGVIGLMWSVFVAGSPATLVTQWQVDSASSTALMMAFHREWNGGARNVSKSRALQRASLELLHTTGFSHPFYWAGLILAGDGR